VTMVDLMAAPTVVLKAVPKAQLTAALMAE
jgi:hypothetical protein